MAKLAVGLSGGVDSSVAAYLLLQEGHELIGVTSLNYPESRCCDMKSVWSARAIAEKLGFPYHTIDLMTPFRMKVVNAFLDGYRQGETPNVCTVCNSDVRFEELYDEAEWRWGVEGFATGHYARRVWNPELQRWQLHRGLDTAKDQSYMLYRLSPQQLERSRFPLGELPKADVRRIAEEAGLVTAKKPDSQDICFAMGNTKGFLEDHLGTQPGDIVDLSGKRLGRHEGIAFYTVGQRRGLGIAAPEPLYVVRLDASSNQVVVGPKSTVFSRELSAREVRWTSVPEPEAPFRAEVQIRYKAAPAPARIEPSRDGLRIVFDEDQMAITPGQVAAIYQGDVLLGGGVISL